jgi:small neutral amino acid transporter SnatA (MarC family)
MMSEFTSSALLLFVLLNPFLMSLYLAPLIRTLDRKTFGLVVGRGAMISGGVFFAFALFGDAVFTDLLQARYAAFQIFGGIIFVMVGLRFIQGGADSIHVFRGDPRHFGGAVAMPFMIGPATVSASIMAGGRLSPTMALFAIAVALAGTTLALLALKVVYDRVNARNEALVNRYWDVTGRVMAIVIGTFAIEMILQGIDTWLGRT